MQMDDVRDGRVMERGPDGDGGELRESLIGAVDHLIETLREEGVDDPLSEQLTLACVVADLFRFTGVAVPQEITSRLSDT